MEDSRNMQSREKRRRPYHEEKESMERDAGNEGEIQLQESQERNSKFPTT